jgi:hypothetical protein
MNMNELILGQFTKEDWDAFISGYAGEMSEDQWIKEVSKNPEYWEDEINGSTGRKRQLELFGDHPDYKNPRLKMKPIGA